VLNINIYLLIGLTITCLLGGIILAFTVSFWYSFPFLLIGVILAIIYVLFGSVNGAAKLIQDQDFDGAEKRLNLTINPKFLWITQRAFFYIMKGSIAMNKNDMKGAEVLFDHALKIDLPSDNEKGMVLLQLANINAGQQKWGAAKNYFREASKLKITEGQIKDQMDQFGKALKNRGAANVARSMGKQGMKMMQQGGGGKRRRPKMR
jgi:tetratricopeptide (TPR) repeat protein